MEKYELCAVPTVVIQLPPFGEQSRMSQRILYKQLKEAGREPKAILNVNMHSAQWKRIQLCS